MPRSQGSKRNSGRLFASIPSRARAALENGVLARVSLHRPWRKRPAVTAFYSRAAALFCEFSLACAHGSFRRLLAPIAASMGLWLMTGVNLRRAVI
jgi:hypothetical protein